MFAVSWWSLLAPGTHQCCRPICWCQWWSQTALLLSLLLRRISGSNLRTKEIHVYVAYDLNIRKYTENILIFVQKNSLFAKSAGIKGSVQSPGGKSYSLICIMLPPGELWDSSNGPEVCIYPLSNKYGSLTWNLIEGQYTDQQNIFGFLFSRGA